VAADALYSRTLVQAKDAPGGEATTLAVVAEVSTFMAWHGDAEHGRVPVAYGGRNEVVEFVALVDGQAAAWLAANGRCVSAREWLAEHADRATAARRSIGRVDAIAEAIGTSREVALARAVHGALDAAAGSMSPDDVVGVLGNAVPTVQQAEAALRVLAEHGLAEATTTGRWRRVKAVRRGR
jgi:hypothetical protein